MIAPLLFFATVAITLGLTRRSLGAGIAAVLTAGYLHGVIRANVVSPFTAFLFDGALFALYIGAYLRCNDLHSRAWRTPLGRWTIALVLWPGMLALIPINHPLIQLVAFHSSVWFALMLMVGTQVSWADVKTAGRWVAVLNLVALGFAIYIFIYGVPAVYPLNVITQLTYRSRDVGTEQWRIPSSFLNAHAYAGAMLTSLPFLAAIGLDPAARRDRLLAILGTVAALAGIIMCGARQPVVVALLAGLITIAITRADFRTVIPLLLAIGAAAIVVPQNERFQRMLSLMDSDLVQDRVQGSVSSDFLDLVVEYPLGAGMGSAFGTSIPSFLQDYAPEKVIGLENEFSKIQINQGVVGLVLWLIFLGWYFCQIPTARRDAPVPIGIAFAYGLTVTMWLTAWIGAGTTAAVPMAASMFLLQGITITAARKSRVRPRMIEEPRTLAEVGAPT